MPLKKKKKEESHRTGFKTLVQNLGSSCGNGETMEKLARGEMHVSSSGMLSLSFPPCPSFHPMVVSMLLLCAPVVTSTFPITVSVNFMSFVCHPNQTANFTKEQPCLSYSPLYPQGIHSARHIINMSGALNKQKGGCRAVREVEGESVISKAMESPFYML